MSRFWSSLTHDLKPYVVGEQPRMAAISRHFVGDGEWPENGQALSVSFVSKHGVAATLSGVSARWRRAALRAKCLLTRQQILLAISARSVSLDKP